MPIFPRRTVGAGHARPCRVRPSIRPGNGSGRRPRRPGDVTVTTALHGGSTGCRAGCPSPRRRGSNAKTLHYTTNRGRGCRGEHGSPASCTVNGRLREGCGRHICRPYTAEVFSIAQLWQHGPGAAFPYLAPLKAHTLKLHFKLHPCKIRADVLQSHSIPF